MPDIRYSIQWTSQGRNHYVYFENAYTANIVLEALSQYVAEQLTMWSGATKVAEIE